MADSLARREHTQIRNNGSGLEIYLIRSTGKNFTFILLVRNLRNGFSSKVCSLSNCACVAVSIVT